MQTTAKDSQFKITFFVCVYSQCLYYVALFLKKKKKHEKIVRVQGIVKLLECSNKMSHEYVHTGSEQSYVLTEK